MKLGPREARRASTPSPSRVLVAVLLALVVTAGPSTAAWWWPTQAAWMETAHVAPDDADGPGQGGSPSHWGVHFGSAVAMDEDTMVVGTQWDRHADNPRSPTGDGLDWAYVFERDPMGAWQQSAKLIPDDAHEGDTFAYSLDVDGPNGVVVGGNPAAEKVYIFERDASGTWSQTASFTLPEDSVGAQGLFGYTVAVSGDTAVAGWSPTSFIYRKVAGEWVESGTVRGGIAVALEGATLVTSVWDPATGLNDYAIYGAADQAWVEVALLAPSDAFDSENTVGCTVALNEDETTIVIGACIDRRVYGIPTEHDVEVGGNPIPVMLGPVGSAWIYDRVGGEWVLTADIPNPDPAPTGDMFGYSVGVSGATVVIGAPWDAYNGGGDGAGAAYVYEKLPGGWTLAAKLRNHDTGPYGGGDLFGYSVAISGTTVAVGAPFDDQRRDGTPWPVDDDGDVPACIHRDLIWGCDEGENAGSVYLFESMGLPSAGIAG